MWASTVWRDRTGIIPEEDFASAPVTDPSSRQGSRTKKSKGKSSTLTDEQKEKDYTCKLL